MAKVNEIDACLPQTQCTECGFDGCLPYAEAIACGQESIDKCPPGGTTTLNQLAELLNIDPTPYLEAVEKNTRSPSLAVIDEAECIGCTKCIQACPVDAIIGSAKQMHSILNYDCTGCSLCVAPCPVDCIEMVELEQSSYNPERARQNYHRRQARLLRRTQQQKRRYLAKRHLAQSKDKQHDIKAKQEYILQALARVTNKTAKHE